MKICVITPRYAVAGVPLAQIRLSQALARMGHDVDLIIGRLDSEYPVPRIEGVKVVGWGTHRVRGMLFALWRYFRSKKPEVVFSAEDHLNAAVLVAAILSNSRTKISCSSRVTPFDTYSNLLFSKRWFLKQLMRCVMWRADALTCVSQGTVEEYREVFNAPRHVCMYNIIDDDASRSKMLEPVEHVSFGNEDADVPLLVAAGRLAPWKGYADLIYAIKALSNRRQVRLVILGDGPSRRELEELIIQLNMSSVVSLAGYVENPLKYFRHADVFVHSARVESLGNVLVEAMMCGCTVVSTDCPTGPREVLGGGKYGYLVPVGDPAAMAAGIEQALDNPISQQLLVEAVRPFEESVVLKKHFELLGLAGP